MTRRIEISFPVDVEFPDDFEQKLDALIGTVCKKYEAAHPDRVMWPAGCGSKPNWSRMDATFLGVEAGPDAPIGGEPTFDDSVYSIDVAERENYDYKEQK